MGQNNKEFEFRGLNHVAMVSQDMQKTVDFYSGVLGMPLIKTIDLPGGLGQHFFFDMGQRGLHGLLLVYRSEGTGAGSFESTRADQSRRVPRRSHSVDLLPRLDESHRF